MSFKSISFDLNRSVPWPRIPMLKLYFTLVMMTIMMPIVAMVRTQWCWHSKRSRPYTQTWEAMFWIILGGQGDGAMELLNAIATGLAEGASWCACENWAQCELCLDLCRWPPIFELPCHPFQVLGRDLYVQKKHTQCTVHLTSIDHSKIGGAYISGSTWAMTLLFDLIPQFIGWTVG